MRDKEKILKTSIEKYIKNHNSCRSLKNNTGCWKTKEKWLQNSKENNYFLPVIRTEVLPHMWSVVDITYTHQYLFLPFFLAQKTIQGHVFWSSDYEQKWHVSLPCQNIKKRRMNSMISEEASCWDGRASRLKWFLDYWVITGKTAILESYLPSSRLVWDRKDLISKP